VTISSTVTTAAKYFQGKGGVVVSPAGNYGTFDSSSDNPYILTVSATDRYDVLTDYSNTGNNIDLAAPGDTTTTKMGGGYISTAGTSFSAPIVAGVVALVLSANPSLTPAQVQDVLEQSADDLGAAGWDSNYGWGRVNAARAVAMAGGAPLPTPSPTPIPTPSPTPTPTPTPAPSPTPTLDSVAPSVSITSPANGATLSVNTSVYINTSDNIGVMRIELYADGVLVSTSTSAPFTMKWNTKKAAKGSHILQTRAYDAAGNVGVSLPITVYK
jgi:subtilisin family serine protease